MQLWDLALSYPKVGLGGQGSVFGVMVVILVPNHKAYIESIQMLKGR